MKTSMRLLSVLSCCVAAGVLLTPEMAGAQPQEARLHVQVPIDFHNPGATTLYSIENYGQMGIWGHDFSIPYAQIEALINAKLTELVPNKFNGVERCTDPCPDVTWSIRIKPKFKFTRTNQPVLTSLGQSGDSRVRAELATEFRLDVHADVHVETWFDSVDVPVDVFIILGLKAGVEVEMWPTLKVHQPGSSAPGLKLEFTLVDSDLDLDLNGTAVELGAKWGTIVGLSPVGVLVGGPIFGPIVAWIADAIADVAERKIAELFYGKVGALIEAKTAGVEDLINDHLLPYVDQANGLKDRVMNSPLPGINRSYNQLSADLGATLQLHTVTPNNGIASSAVLRMTGAAGSGKLKGVVRMPKKVCEYAHVSGGPLAGATLPLGLVDANTGLAAKVGQACASLSSSPLKARTFLGGNPRLALGATAQELPVWKDNAGQSKWTGTMTQTDKWYECGFEISSLPNAAVVALDSAAFMTDHHVEVTNRRFLEARVGAQLVFDEQLKPVAGGSIVFGGEGKCGGGGGGRGIEADLATKIKDMLNPEKCPQCGLQRKPGSEHVIEITNDQAFLATQVGKELLKTVQSYRAAPGIKASAKMPALNKPAANKPAVNKPAVNK